MKNHREQVNKWAARLHRRARGALGRREARHAADLMIALECTDFIGTRAPGTLAREWADFSHPADRASAKRFAVEKFCRYGSRKAA